MKKVLLLSNMYPSQEYPSYGVFIKSFTDNLENNLIPYDKVVMLKSNTKIKKICRYIVFFIKSFFTVLLKKYDIIYIHYPSITSIPVLAVSKFKKYNIYTNIHGTDADPVTDKEKKLEKNTKKSAELSNKIIVPSQYFKDMIVKKYNIESKEIIVYPSGGINTGVFYPQPESEIEKFKKELFGISKEVIVIGFVSRIEKSKGWMTFIEALNNLKKENKLSNVKVVMIGSGKDDAKLLKTIEDYQLSEFIVRKKLVSQIELNQYFNVFSFLVFPTKKESLGLVALESMATKTPIIASNIPPLNEYIIPNETGFLFEKENAKELAENITKMMGLNEYDFNRIKNQAYSKSREYTKENCNTTFRMIFDL